MTAELILTLTAVFISIALVSGSIASALLGRTAPELKRLRQGAPANTGASGPPSYLKATWATRRASKSLRKSPNQGSRLQSRLMAAGWDDPLSAWLYSTGQLVMPILTGLIPLLVLGVSGLPVALVTGVVGYLIPDSLLLRQIAQRKRAIQSGLPDALDLLVVCVEAGSSLDQAILRTSEELEIALPAMAHELRVVATGIRAGKPRLDAFQDLARRTGLDEVRALVAVLIQTDRFGTSIAQALRTHADTLRTKRRQRAEERAGKVGVKLVFPLVLCLLPALYAVCLGPVVVRAVRTFGGN
jgi:tight adherence protein C